jgi:hypothetical protein
MRLFTRRVINTASFGGRIASLMWDGAAPSSRLVWARPTRVEGLHPDAFPN